jgi:exosome complex exonuclease DIS3/RRP44
MLKSKSFVKKTKRGSVVKVVKEHYLRDDIGCGSEKCRLATCNRDELPRVLSARPIILPKIDTRGHYLVPDTNVLLHQIDILEHEMIRDVIVTQTALEELKHLNLGVSNRIRRLISDRNKRFYMFSNEHHP